MYCSASTIAIMIALLFILASPAQLTKYLVWTMGAATVFSGYPSQQTQININSQKIVSDFAGIYVRDEFADAPGQEIFVIGSDKQLVEASIFWMDRPGVTFDLYNAGSLIPDELIPDDRKVIVQILGVLLEDPGSEPVLGADYVISFVDYSCDFLLAFCRQQNISIYCLREKTKSADHTWVGKPVLIVASLLGF